jgi:ABC-type sugar transport system, periplasmic component
MRRNVKLVSLAILAIMIAALTACSSNNNNGEASSAAPTGSNANASASAPASSQNELTKDPYEITVAMPVLGAVPADIGLVQDEISKITKEKINATVKLMPISIGAYTQQLNLMSSSGEKLDAYVNLGANYNADVAAGKYVELDELLDKYGQDLKSQFDPVYLSSTKIDGKTYGVPVLKDYTTGQGGFAMRKDLVDKYKIDLASIKSMDDMDKVFQTIKDNEPNITPLGVGLSGPLSQLVWFDKLGDKYGVLPGFDNGLKIENLYESQEYADTLNIMHRWFKAGYISKDAATSQTSTSDLVKADKAFAYWLMSKPGGLEGEMRMAGKELVFAPVTEGVYSTTSDTLLGIWGISVNSKNPERTMMFMNLLYSDPAIANLMQWGIEGKHYVKTSDTSVDFPSGVTVQTVGYSNQAWLIGNPFITFTFKGEPLDKWEQVKQANANALKSKALGFLFNSEPVKNEITALNNVRTQYEKILETGTVDPADKLEEFNKKLKAAGIEKVITEKQKQLDAWAAANQ